MSKVKDMFWIWGHEVGSHNNRFGLKGASRMTPAEGAFYLGVSNLIMVRFPFGPGDMRPSPPFDQYMLALSPLKQVVWSIVGASGRAEPDEVGIVLDLARRFPNICGVIMDDFFKMKQNDDGQIAVYTPDELKAIKKRLTVDGKKLELWVTLYTHNLNLPNVEKHLEQCDVITYWTWHADELKKLEQNLNRLEEVMPHSRKMLGCYMWDYGSRNPMPVYLMQHQCNLGLKWLLEGRIEGMIFLASCICDLGLDAVEWTRQWIREVKEKTLRNIETKCYPEKGSNALCILRDRIG